MNDVKIAKKYLSESDHSDRSERKQSSVNIGQFVRKCIIEIRSARDQEAKIDALFALALLNSYAVIGTSDRSILSYAQTLLSENRRRRMPLHRRKSICTKHLIC